MKMTIKVPEEIIKPALEQIKDFVGIGNIGKVYCPGDWNNWGDSMEKAGCIRPKPEMEMVLKGEYYELEVDLGIGLHRFKPAVVAAEADENGMAPAIWITCPPEGCEEYFQEKGDHFGNWTIKVLPKK
jgi:hypothetical protein